jgi:hypothetical protein
VHGFAALEMRGALEHPADREASFAWLIEMFVAAPGEALGLGSPGGRV